MRDLTLALAVLSLFLLPICVAWILIVELQIRREARDLALWITKRDARKGGA